MRHSGSRGCGNGGDADRGFNRGETVRNGAGWFQINAAEDGTRMSSSHAYLHPILESRRNLEVRTGCWVAEILFDDALSATGVRYQRPDLTGHDTVSARREVVVTAGAIDTPKLLMLSGIGPECAPAGDGHRRPSRLPGRRIEPRRPRRGPGVLGGVQADGDDVHPVVGDRVVHHASTRAVRPSPT